MSRVDEAMRRAFELADATPDASETQPAAAAALNDELELAGETFPLELPSVPRVTPSAATVAAFPHAAPPASPLPRVAPAPLLSLMERIDGSVAEKIVVDQTTDATSREQYRRLAATLHHAKAANGLKVIIVSSAVPGEGKTLTAANLALTFSESYERSVLLIDADLRRPALHSIFHIDNSTGLSDGLTAMEQRPLPVRQFSPRLAILPAGRETADPTAGLTSERMRMLVAEARKVFDWVIIDTPPVALLADANLLAAMADGVIIVIKAGSTHLDLIRRAIDAIGRERVLGVVLNRAEDAPHAVGYGYYGSYGVSAVEVGTHS